MKRIMSLCILLGCSGQVLGPLNSLGQPGTSSGSGSGSGSGTGSGAGTGTGNGAPVDPNVPPGPEVFGRELPAVTSRAARLSQSEYENTIQDLLGAPQPLGISKDFVKDPSSTMFSNNGGEFTIVGDQWLDYQRAAEDVALKATATLDTLTKVCGGKKPDTAQAMVESAGLRMYRRPLKAAESAALVALHAKGKEFYPQSDAFLAGARVVIEAMLQSPHFLYRIENSIGVINGVVPLSAYELATRLSFALWQTIPDAALFEAAANQSLLTDAGFLAAVERMLESERARRAMRKFHAELFSTSKYLDITRSTTLFPEFKTELKNAMYQEQALLTDAVVFADNGGVSKLFTAPYSFVDSSLAAVYALPGTFGAGFDKYTFANKPRQGVLTQIGFLAANSTSTESDPIHRGVFINHRILCSEVPAPPANVPPLPAVDPNAPPQTLRERITGFTGKGTCGAGCHSTYINPIGFAFEKYDALGRDRLKERNGRDIDAKDSFVFKDGQPATSFDGAVELSNLIANERSTHQCYAKHLIEFLFGRQNSKIDDTLIRRVGLASQQGNLSIKQLAAELVKSESFRNQAVTQ